MKDGGVLYRDDENAQIACYWKFQSLEETYDPRDSSAAEMSFVLQSAENAELFIYKGHERASAESLIEGGDRMYLGTPVRVPITQPVIVVFRLATPGEFDAKGNYRSKKGSFELS